MGVEGGEVVRRGGGGRRGMEVDEVDEVEREPSISATTTPSKHADHPYHSPA